MGKSKHKKVYITMLIALGLLTVVSIIPRLLVGMDIDEQSSQALIYRLAMGDVPVLEVWDAHQGAALIPALFLKAFMTITGGIDYMCLFLRVLGLLFQIITAVIWYLGFRKKYDRITVAITALLILNVLPRWIQSPEVANTTIWWSILLIVALNKYVDTQKLIYQILASLCMVGLTLAYPSMVILYVAIIIFLVWAKKKWVAFAVIPPVSAIAFVGLLLTKMSIRTLLHCMKMIVTGEEYSVGIINKVLLYAKDTPLLMVEMSIIITTALIAYAVVARVTKERPGYKFFLGVLLTFTLIGQVFHWFILENPIVHPQLHYMLVFVIGLIIYRYSRIDVKEKNMYMYRISLMVSIALFVSALVMTRSDIKAACAYLLPGMLFAIMLAGESTSLEEIRNVSKQSFIIYAFILCAFVVVLGRSLLVKVNAGIYADITLDRQKVLYTACDNIYFTYNEGYKYNLNYEDLAGVVEPGQKVMYLGLDNLVYPLLGTQVCSAEVNSIPAYNYRYMEYYRVNPDKEPEVVLLSLSYEGIIHDLEFYDWLNGKKIIYVE